MSDWSVRDMPAQTGKVVAITGATGGLGFQTALAMSHAGAEVILIGRDVSKGRHAINLIATQIPDAKLRFENIDLGSLASIRQGAERLLKCDLALDILVNSAGLMSPSTRTTTTDGFEIQFGTNHLGHFLLTSLVLPLLRRRPNARVVSVSSIVHRAGSINFDDLQALRRYVPFRAYGQSKLANLLFAFELQRRSAMGNWRIMSNAAHPGAAQTDLIANGPGEGGMFHNLVFPLISQSAAAGSLPILFAATSPEALPGGYYGPGGVFELKGSPRDARIGAKAKDMNTASTLWEISTALTDARWPA